MDTSWFDEFYAEGLVTEVIAQLKSGKEATVFLCRAAESNPFDLVAIKTYHHRLGRGFRNRSAYTNGRPVSAGVARAIAKRTSYGKEAAEAMWINHEFDMLCALHGAGADVPEPFGASGRTIAMQCIGDANVAGLQLRLVDLTLSQAKRYLGRILWNIERFLAHDVVHADLSPYNILVWNDRPWIIDFPQAVDARKNETARELLFRDVDRVCMHFSRYGVEANSIEFATSLWRRYQRAELRH